MPNPDPKAKPILAEDGWRKHSGDFYTRPLVPGVRGLLGLSANRDLPYQWKLKPYVGVIDKRVNALARTLTGSADTSRYPQATIRYHLIRLLEGPHAQERDRWLIAAEAVDGNELRDGNGPQRRTPLLAAALWMQGDVAAAEARLAEIESKFGGPPPEVPARCAVFA